MYHYQLRAKHSTMKPSLTRVQVFTKLLSTPWRTYSTQLQKVPAKLIGELRRTTDVSITRAREALSASKNDLKLALEWLKKDLVISGEKQSAKLKSRTTGEGVISTCILSNGCGPPIHTGVRASMVELNCETDFVARNKLFVDLAADIAHTTAFLGNPSKGGMTFQDSRLDFILDAPLISQHQPCSYAIQTVKSSILDMISRVGEKISLRRSVTATENLFTLQNKTRLRIASYSHGSTNTLSQGRIGTMVLLSVKSSRLHELLESSVFRDDLERLGRALCRQITGFKTTSITDPKDEHALYNQIFSMIPDCSDDTVYDVLRTWSQGKGIRENEGLEVIDFRRWTVGEAL